MASPQEQEAAMIARLPELTGRTLDEWLTLIASSGFTAHGKIVALLKSEHDVSHGYANLIAHKALRSDAASSGSGDDLVMAQYKGARAGIKPIYDAIISQVRTFGEDVEIAPKKTYVSLRRAKQFALLQPAASIGSIPEVDAELIGWLRQAYERA